ncbi:hypothetical protein HXY32_07955 [Candidatus Bathyarchaeota archaeon]|nr:hypothetical protein [Candidatus Bathyarchaeota archaeon]
MLNHQQYLREVSYYVYIDFETSSAFTLGIEHSDAGNPNGARNWNAITKTLSNTPYTSPWDEGGYFQSNYPNAYNYKPVTTPVHGGTRSALLELVNPTDQNTNRLQLLHFWDAYTEDIWIESWFYLPVGFNIGPGDIVTLQKTISERCWKSDGTYYQFNGPGVAIMIDGRKDRPSYNMPIFVVQRGQAGGAEVPDGYQGLPDVFVSDAKQTAWPWQWVNGKAEWVPVFGQWFMIRQHVYRNVGDFLFRNSQAYNNGIYEIWMAFPPNYAVEKVYPVRTAGNSDHYIPDKMRTVGIYPDMLRQTGWYNVGGNYAYIASGCALYATADGVNRRLYLDDVILAAGKVYTYSATSTSGGRGRIFLW